MPARIYAVATLDTKGEELAYVARCLRRAGLETTIVDVGVHSPATVTPDVTREQVEACGASRFLPAAGQSSDRGQAVTAMSAALVAFLTAEHAAGRVAGVIGLGGGGGTALICPAMRALPIGTPKLMVSTMASGDTRPYVGGADIVMMHSVVDVAGLNSVSRRVLANAAHAIAGMASRFGTENEAVDAARPTLAMTMFGVTTPCVDRLRRTLEADGFDCLVFHATGSGDRAMEDLVRSRLVDGVIDVTTTAVADQVVGGVLASGEARFDAILESRVPYVVSLGALDMVNFGARETVPERFADRRLHVHNAQVTLMRTDAEECRRIARWIAAKLNRATAPLTLLIPEAGLSALDAPGQPFHDPTVDRALFNELEAGLHQTPARRLRSLPLHVNDPEFAAALAAEFLRLRSDSLDAPR